MGVRGLLAFLKDTAGGSSTLCFSPNSEPQTASSPLKESLIIDGNALVHHIAKATPECSDSIPVLARAVTAFAAQLANIFNLTVLFDGPLPKWKYQQRIEREREKIAKLEREYYDGILSPLSLIACMQSLCARQAENGFTVRVAEGEADLAITELSRSQNAYISSSDSDFYIHSCRGYFPLDGLSVAPDGSVVAVVWTYDVVAKQLGIHVDMLPLLAYVAGCDYTLDERQWQIVNSRLCSGTTAARRIRAIANHLKPYDNLQDGINSLLPKPSSPTQAPTNNDAFIAEVTAIADLFTGRYGTANTCPVTRYPPLPCTSTFPYTATISSALKSHKFVEIQNGVFWCQSLIEDLSRSPAWEVSRPIRRKMYHILEIPSVAEYIRRNLEFRVEHVSALAVETTATPTTANVTAIPSYLEDSVVDAYISVMGLSVTPKFSSLNQVYTPLVCSIRYLSEQWKDTAFQLKNFELVALLCMAIQSLSAASNSAASTTTTTTIPSPSRSKQTSHLLASLETILFSAWLLHQSLTPTNQDVQQQQ
ncbi:hypothetical protein BDR26DRAFT_868556, partial [Obelidium mucronatum]